MKACLTGATGFIGAVLAEKLIARGDTVHALVRTPSKGAFLEKIGVRLFQGDLSEGDALAEAMKGCDTLFHLAAFAKVWAKDPATYFDVNVLGTEEVLKAALASGIKRTVITSTAGIWGPSLREPIREERARDIDFLNEYESSKALADLRAKDYIIRHGMEIVFLCPTRVFGPFPAGEPASVTSLIDRYVHRGWRIIPGNGRQLGNYVYVEDVAEAHILAAQKGESGRSYIIGGENCSYNRFFELVGEASGISRRMIHLPLFIQRIFTWIQLAGALLFGAEPELTPSWMGKSLYDWEVTSRRARDELGYRPRPLRDGIEQTAGWSRSRRKGGSSP